MSAKPDNPCPSPKILRHATLNTANAHAHDDTFIHGVPSEAFQCVCGWLHVGRAKGRIPRIQRVVTRSQQKDRR